VPDKSTAVDPAVRAGAALRRARLDRGLSLRALAGLLGVSPATLSAVENGRRELSLDRAAQAARLLGARAEELRPASAGRPAPPPAAPTPTENGPNAETVADQDWRSFAPLHLGQPLTAALEAFLEFGYHGATMRDIAGRAGLSVPGVYHYYASKQDMLVAILELTMADLLARTTAAGVEGRNPVERFSLLVECLALYHTHRRELGFVGASEMRSLEPVHRERVAAARRAQQRMVDEAVDEAVAEGSFAVERPHEASRAVVTMCTALPQWFDGRGPTPPETVAAQYVDFALDLMRCTPEARRRAARLRRGA
jgi:AcrR family transcriptional regulator/DNA-binding XRE family transcriptional regulator